MQPIAPVVPADFLAADQLPLMKLEIYTAGVWVNLNDTPVERLLDGELEDWADVTDLTYWTESGRGGGFGMFRETGIVHSGIYSAGLLTSAGGDICWFRQDFTLTPGNNCKVSAWYLRGAHVSSDLRLYISDVTETVFLKADGTWQVGAVIIDLAVSAIWKLFELEFQAHPDYTDYRIRFYKGHGAGGAISFYVDDVSVTETRNTALEVWDGGNYVESASVSLGGASMTPNPIEGTWEATLFNEDGVFHPQHPTSPFRDYLKTERLVRLSIGAIYGGTDYSWQRVIGYMDVPDFSTPDYRVSIRGGDYMKRLRDTELKFGTTGDNYWGDHEHFTSIASDGLTGAEIYAEGDAMEIGGGEANNVANWVATNCDFASFADVGGGSTFVGRCINQTTSPVRLNNPNVGAAVAGQMYQAKFKHRIVGGTGVVGIRPKIIQASGVCVSVTYFPTDTWKEETFYFTALDTGAIEWRFQLFPISIDLRLDQFSIFHFIPYWQQNYPIADANSKGPSFVTIDGDPVWQGEVDEGWYYAEDAEAGPDPPAHDARIVYFDANKTVMGGLDLIVYYFLQQEAEDVVARLLFKAGLYTSEANALAAIIAHPDYVDPNVQIDNVWFKSGTTCLDAVKKVCERCDYRFYFDYDGEPVFRPKPTAGVADFTFTSPAQIASISTYHAQSEIKNRVVIKGMKRAEPVEKEETAPSYWKGEDSDGDSIIAYGERTLTINNHLFQEQAPIDAMCTSLVAEYKDPKWYSDLSVPFNPVPLQLGDNIQWEERLSPTLDITQAGIIRDIKINRFDSTYKCEHT